MEVTADDPTDFGCALFLLLVEIHQYISGSKTLALKPKNLESDQVAQVADSPKLPHPFLFMQPTLSYHLSPHPSQAILKAGLDSCHLFRRISPFYCYYNCLSEREDFELDIETQELPEFGVID